MVGVGVAARKLWTSFRASVTANGRGMKSRLAAMNLLKKKKKKKKKKGRCRNASMSPTRHTDRYEHYNYSDEEEMDNRIKKKLSKLSKLVSLPRVGKRGAEFVYVTDLYTDQREFAEGNDIKANAASGSSQAEPEQEQHIYRETEIMGRKSQSLDDQVDTQADLFIAKFYDEMKMQRQKSLGEYREMLERGAT